MNFRIRSHHNMRAFNKSFSTLKILAILFHESFNDFIRRKKLTIVSILIINQLFLSNEKSNTFTYKFIPLSHSLTVVELHLFL